MSCISKILELKGDRDVLPVGSRFVIEGGGLYKDYEFLITFNLLGFRCGYVAIPPEHPIHKLEGYDIPIDAHGGITFNGISSMPLDLLGHSCEDKWIGFDCGHHNDIHDIETARKYFSNAGNEIEWGIFENMENRLRSCDKGLPKFMHRKKRSMAYIANECRGMINQLIEGGKF